MKTKTFKTGELVIDSKLTNIRSINSGIVSQYRQHYRTGAEFPRIVIQLGSKRVVSGNHRLTAMRHEFGNDHEIEVEVRKYNTEAEVLEDFARENASHGHRFDGISRQRLYMAMVEEGISAERASEILFFPVKRIESMPGNMVMVSIGGEPTPMPVKRGFVAPSEKPIDEDTYNRHMKKDMGISIINMVTMLTVRLGEGTVPISEHLFVALDNLQKGIVKFLKKHKVKA